MVLPSGVSHMHLVNVHWSGGAIRYQQSLPCIASFVPTMNVATTLFWSRIASLHITSFTHTECSFNHQSLLSHQYKAHWMSTVSPASCVSPVWSTMNVHRITSLSPVSCTINVSWDGVAIRITSFLRFTSFKPNVCPLEWCCYQKHLSPFLTVTMTPFMYTVNVPWCSIVIRDHQSVTAKSQFHAYSNVRWMVLPGWITKAPPHLIYNVSHTHSHTPSVQWEMVLPPKVTNHSIVLSTVHLCTQWKVILHIAGHCDLTPTVHPDDSLMHAVNP